MRDDQEVDLQRRVQGAHDSRRAVVDLIDACSEPQGSFRAAPDRWSLQEICEHLVHAEEIGINFIWRAADALERGEQFSGEHTNAGLTIERVVETTWQPKETAP